MVLKDFEYQFRSHFFYIAKSIETIGGGKIKPVSLD